MIEYGNISCKKCFLISQNDTERVQLLLWERDCSQIDRTPKHVNLPFTQSCPGSQLLSFLEVLGNNSCNPFYRWFSWGRTIVCPDAFVLLKISSRSVFDDV